MLEWSTAGPAVGAAFLASIVEVVEAFTIVLVVATLRGWKPAVLGTGAALFVLAAIVVILGPLLDQVPLHLLQLVIGVLLLLFGIGWLRKAALRAGGVIPLHDEDAIFARETADLTAEVERRQTSQDWIAGIAAFKAVLLEGLEVIFIVIAVGAGRGMLWLPVWARLRPAYWCFWSGPLLIGRWHECRKTPSSSALASCYRPSAFSGPAKVWAWIGQGMTLPCLSLRRCFLLQGSWLLAWSDSPSRR
jgi:hypothetical protein|uniref:TMEM165/GDT1 family protein n=1 Tax=Roseovarius sp. BRH_c41 TaxID=1629709 RepID=UPI000A5E185B|nr:TMEM165/GDT1 family protein [Roseovarius sp. BRH_c41]